MAANKIYKYINLLFRILIGIVALGFIYFKLKDDFYVQFQQFDSKQIHYLPVVVAFLMLFINWGLEALKWRYSIRGVEKITISKAFRLTFTGITLGLITPNRIGEIPARAFLLNRNSFQKLTLKTAVSSFSQMVITLLVGGIAFILTYNQFSITINLSIIYIVFITSILIMFLVYFGVSKLEVFFNRVKYFKEKTIFKALSEFSFVELLNLLLLSLLRYIVFSVQFWLVLTAFGVSLNTINNIIFIPVCFMITSFIPTLLISEIGVRGSVALFVFGTISDMGIQIILASVLLWIINVGFPAILGMLNIKEFKMLKEN